MDRREIKLDSEWFFKLLVNCESNGVYNSNNNGIVELVIYKNIKEWLMN